MPAKFFSFKMLPKAYEAYLEFQRHVFRYSNKLLFTLPGDSYFSPFPHKTVSVCCTFGEHRAVSRCAACIWRTIVNEVNWPSVQLRILQDTAADYVHSSSLFSVWYNCWSCLFLLQV